MYTLFFFYANKCYFGFIVFLCRYSREAPFIALNVDIRNHHSLLDSMEQFVKGDLLEGANAYHCEKCDKKVLYCKRCYVLVEHLVVFLC